MSFQDYSATPANNTTIGDTPGTFIGPNMPRDNVRPALQQLAADGRELYDYVVASNGGSDLPSFIQAGDGAVARTVQARLRDTFLLVTDFGGVDPTGVTDSYAGIIAARDEAIATSKALVFPQGQYRCTQPLQFGYSRLKVLGIGLPVIQADFAGEAVVKFSTAGAYHYGTQFENFVLLGNGSANQDGYYGDNSAEGIRRNIYVRNVTREGFSLNGEISCLWEKALISYRNNGDGAEAKPARGWGLNAGTYASTTNACTFVECVVHDVLAATGDGVDLVAAGNNVFVNCKFEGLPRWGMRFRAGAVRNTCLSVYCEQNATADATAGDFEIAGHDNTFIHCESYNTALNRWQFDVLAGAKGNRIEKCGVVNRSTGDHATRVRIAATAEDTVVRDCPLYELSDAGTRTWLENWSEQATKIKNGTALWDGNAGTSGFVPAFGGTTVNGTYVYDVREGSATRNGRRVFFDVSLRISGITSGAIGEAKIIGFPAAWPAAEGLASLAEDDSITYPGAATMLGGTVSNDGVFLRFNKGGGALDAATFGVGDFVRMTGSYLVA